MSNRSVAVAVVLFMAWGLIGTSRCGLAEETSPDDQRQALLVSLARDHTLTAPTSGKGFQLSEQPVVHYTNPVRDRGTSDGVTFLWLDGRLPVAASSFSIRRPDDSLRFECVTFSETPLELKLNDTVTWAPTRWQTAPQKLSGVPAPAALERLRMTQMRQIGRLFDARCTRRNTLEVSKLRLMPQPLHRFSDPERGIVDGALFAYVISNDPELLLRLEVVKQAGSLEWRYAFARMTSLQVDVRWDDNLIWHVANFYELGGTSTQPYIEGRIPSN